MLGKPMGLQSNDDWWQHQCCNLTLPHLAVFAAGGHESNKVTTFELHVLTAHWFAPSLV
jgi:hypothetical protein